MLKMVDGTGIIGVDMVCPLGGAVSPPQPPNYDNVEMEGVGSLMLPNSLKAPIERLELIGNSTQGENPAPDNPQEIKSAGRKSKNLLNLQKQPDVKKTYLGWKVSDGRNVVLSVKDKGNNADITGCYLGLSRTGGSSDGVVWVVKNGSVAVKEVVSKNQYVSVFPSNETIVRKLLERFDIQVEYGNNATDYEPYGYLLDVKVTGRNILSDVKGMYNIFVPCFIKAGTTVTLITNGVESDGGNILFTTDSGEDYWYAIDKGKIKVAKSIRKNMIGFKNLLAKKDGLKYCLVIGDTDNYEPYTEQTVQIALDEPLRGIKRITDGKNVQESLNSSGITRRFEEIEITKNARIVTDLGDYGAPEINTVLCRYYDTSLKKTGAILCGELKNINNWIEDKESVATTEQGIDFRLSRERLGIGSDTTPEENKVAVIKYLENHPLHCIAELNEPITEPLPESVQQQLQALQSENGTTHVFVDSGEVEAGIKLTYRKEK